MAQSLSGIENKDVLRWLSDSDQRDWLQQHADKAWLRELIMKYPLPLRFQRAKSSGELLLRGDAAVDPQRISQLMADALDEPFELQLVAGSEEAEGSAAYAATSPGGQRLIVGWSTVQYETDGLPDELASQLDGPLQRLTIAILDDQRRATKRLFGLAAAAAESDAIAFSWHDNTIIWFGSDLQQRLQWQDRVPASPEVLHSPLIGKAKADDDDEPETAAMAIEQWQRLWDQSGERSLSIDVAQSTRGCSELIPCRLERIDVDNFRLKIRPTADSKIDPLIKAGVAYTCAVHLARMPKEQ